jgi:hypothetical protein
MNVEAALTDAIEVQKQELLRAYHGDWDRVFQHEQANLISEWLEEIESLKAQVVDLQIVPGVHRNAKAIFLEIAATAARAAAAMDKKAGQEA